MHRRHLVLLALLLGTPLFAGAAPETMVTLGVPGQANATPWMAARGAMVAVAWGATPPGGKTDVYVAVSRDSGATFGRPVRVNHVPGEARLGGEMPPRVALAGGAASTEVVVAWGARVASKGKESSGGGEERTEIHLARSTDGGRSFGPATALQAPGAAGDRGWHALALDDRGRAAVVWLDHRGLATRTPTEHDHHAAGAEMAQLSSLYFASAGAGAAAPAEREVTKGVCYCCKTALATAPGGRIFAAWRQVYPGNIRDIAFTMSTDRGRTFLAPERVSHDDWALAGCPDDGPAMAVGADGLVHIVWPTVIGGDEPAGALFYATTRDGRTFTPRQRVPTLGSPKPGHPQIVLTGSGQAIVAWDEILNGVRRAGTVALQVDAAGRASFAQPRLLTETGPAAYPMLTATPAGPLAAWTSGPPASSQIAIQRLAR